MTTPRSSGRSWRTRRGSGPPESQVPSRPPGRLNRSGPPYRPDATGRPTARTPGRPTATGRPTARTPGSPRPLIRSENVPNRPATLRCGSFAPLTEANDPPRARRPRNGSFSTRWRCRRRPLSTALDRRRPPPTSQSIPLTHRSGLLTALSAANIPQRCGPRLTGTLPR